MHSIASWFATSPIASALRTAIGVAVGAFINSLLKSPELAVLIACVIPPALRAINPADGVFGKGAATVQDPAV